MLIGPKVRYGSFATDPFSASVEQCPLCADSDRGVAMPRTTLCATSRHWNWSAHSAAL